MSLVRSAGIGSRSLRPIAPGDSRYQPEENPQRKDERLIHSLCTNASKMRSYSRRPGEHKLVRPNGERLGFTTTLDFLTSAKSQASAGAITTVSTGDRDMSTESRPRLTALVFAERTLKIASNGLWVIPGTVTDLRWPNRLHRQPLSDCTAS